MSRRLNILLVNETSGPGGAETVVFELARNLDPDRFNVSVVLARSGWFLGHLRENGVTAEVIASYRRFDVSFMQRLARHCHEHKIDLMHSHLPGINMYCSIVGWLSRIPVVTTAHNELYLPGSSEKFSGVKNFIIRNLASQNVIVAEYMRDNYISLGKYRPDTLTTIHNGIHFEPVPGPDVLASLRLEVGLSPNDIVIGNVANLRTPKGHQYLVEAAGIVCRELPQARFLLIGEKGDGSIKSMIEQKIKALGIESQVMQLGFRTDIPQLLHLLDIFVLASISEGLPLSVVEAMAARKPVVVTDVGGLSEVVRENEDGYLVPPANSSQLAEKLILLARDRQLRETMGARGHERVRHAFSLETMIDKYQTLYLSLTK